MSSQEVWEVPQANNLWYSPQSDLPVSLAEKNLRQSDTNSQPPRFQFKRKTRPTLKERSYMKLPLMPDNNCLETHETSILKQ